MNGQDEKSVKLKVEEVMTKKVGNSDGEKRKKRKMG